MFSVRIALLKTGSERPSDADLNTKQLSHSAKLLGQVIKLTKAAIKLTCQDSNEAQRGAQRQPGECYSVGISHVKRPGFGKVVPETSHSRHLPG